MYLPNGHQYGVFKELSSIERKLVKGRLEELISIGEKREQLQSEQQRLLQDLETSEDAIKINEINLAILDCNRQSETIQAELTEMMTSALHNCFRLIISQTDKIEREEKIAIFRELAGH